MKTCPFCAESDLQDAAVVCKHCGKRLSSPALETTPENKWKRTMLAFWGAVMLALIWGGGTVVQGVENGGRWLTLVAAAWLLMLPVFLWAAKREAAKQRATIAATAARERAEQRRREAQPAK